LDTAEAVWQRLCSVCRSNLENYKAAIKELENYKAAIKEHMQMMGELKR
jgi:hypothetical protein